MRVESQEHRNGSVAIVGGVQTDAAIEGVIAGPADKTVVSCAAIEHTGALPASAFTIGEAATSAAHRIVFEQATGVLFFDSDGDGGGMQVQFASVASGIAISDSDFFVI